jgi:hypothetical protein
MEKNLALLYSESGTTAGSFAPWELRGGGSWYSTDSLQGTEPEKVKK